MSRRSVLRLAVGTALFGLALGLGFLVSSQLGQRWMREEAELQLGLLLGADVQIERIALRLRYGLEVHGTQIRVAYSSGKDAAVSAAHASASFETTSLLIGRLRIARLEIEGLQLDLQRDSEGTWSPPYFRSRTEIDAQRADDSDLESRLSGLRGLIESAHFLLRDQRVADDIVLRDAAVTLVDAGARQGTTAPGALRVEGIDAKLDRSWLRGESDIEGTGTWLGPSGRPAPIELAGRWRDDDRDLRVTVAFTGIELRSLRPYLVSTEQGDIAGRVTGVVAIVTPQRDRGLIELDWTFDDLESETPLGSSRIKLSSALETLQARLSLEPRRLRLESARFQGQSLEVRLRGSASRPLRPESLVTLRADLSRTELGDLRRLALGLPPAEAKPFLEMLDRIRSGHVRRVGVRGGARLDEWIELLRGRRGSLPSTLRVFADIDDVTFGTSPTDTMSDVSARLTFSGETFEMHGLQAHYNGEPLPLIDFAVRGVSRLLGPTLEDQRLTRRARPLPGLGTLWDIVRGERDAQPGHPPAAIRVQLDELQHPALRWPIRNARIEIDPTERDLHLSISQGEWAGHPILGEAILDRDPDPALRIELVLAGAEAAATPEPAAEVGLAAGEPGDPAERKEVERDAAWARGRITTTGINAGSFVLEQVEGIFALRGQTLAVSQVEASLAGGGSLEGSASFALDRKGEVPVGVDLVVTGADADRVAQLFGLSPGFATGRADMHAELAGPVRPDSALIGELVGRIAIDAQDGEIQQQVPLLAAVAHAIEGWSPAAASETLQYEQIEAHVDFQRGRLSTDRFALEGPLRIVASGAVDLNQDPVPIEATFAFFLLRQADQLLGNIPLVNLLVPGSDRGLIGAYFEATGPLDHPTIRPLPMKSIAEGVPLPAVLRQPFDALQGLFSRTATRRQHDNGGPR